MIDYIKKNWLYVLLIALLTYLMLNMITLIFSRKYEVRDYEIVYGCVVVQVEKPRNTLDTIMFEPEQIWCSKERTNPNVEIIQLAGFKIKTLYLPKEDYDKYREMLFDE